MTEIELDSAGMVALSLGAPCARVRARGCTATLNGRSWFSITGVVSRNSGREAFRAGPRLRANGCSAVQGGGARGGEGLHLGQRLLSLPQRRRELGQGLLELGVVGGDRREVGVRRADERGELVLDAAEGVGDQVEVVDGPADVAPAGGQQGGEALGLAIKRREAFERAAQVGHRRPARRDLVRARVVEGLCAGGQQQDEVVARVGVERGQDLREVDIRLGCWRPSSDPPSGTAPAVAGARIQLQVHVLQRRARPQQHGGVAVNGRRTACRCSS